MRSGWTARRRRPQQQRVPLARAAASREANPPTKETSIPTDSLPTLPGRTIRSSLKSWAEATQEVIAQKATTTSTPSTTDRDRRERLAIETHMFSV